MESKKILKQKMIREEIADDEIKKENEIIQKEGEGGSGWLNSHIHRLTNMDNIMDIVMFTRSIQVMRIN